MSARLAKWLLNAAALIMALGISLTLAHFGEPSNRWAWELIGVRP